MHLKQVVLLKNATLEFQILPCDDKKGYPIDSLANNPCPIMFQCTKICVSYTLSHDN